MNNSDSLSLVEGPSTATCMMWAEQKQGKEKRDLLMHTDWKQLQEHWLANLMNALRSSVIVHEVARDGLICAM
jgi:hypothetical protein